MGNSIVGDPNVCAKHGCPLVSGRYMDAGELDRLCPKCHWSGSCPTHPQAQVWNHQDGIRCAICGYFYDGRDPPPDEPSVYRSFARYREEAARTDGDHPVEYYAGGLCEEAGELWRLVKRAVYHGHTRDADQELGECGDVLWVLDRLAAKLGFTLEQAAEANARKLRRRYPTGYSSERSVNRDDP